MPIISIREETKFNRSFVIADWIFDDNDLYYLDIVHSFDSFNIHSGIYDEIEQRVIVHEEVKLNLNTYRLFVTADPDARFSGIIHLVKT